MQVAWEWLQTHPNMISAELALCLRVTQGNVSSALTQMYRRGMVERKRRTWINENARQQTSFEYSAVGTGTYVLKAIAFVPAHPRKPYAVRAQERRDAAEARAEKWKDIPVVPDTVAVPVPLPLAYDIENMTVKQARALREQLNAFFGGVK